MQQETIKSNECQFAILKSIAEGNVKAPPASLIRHIRLAIKRHLTPNQDKAIHQKVNAVIDWFYKLIGKNISTIKSVPIVQREFLKAGDLVRVKSKEEIEATLNHLGQLRGCGFMADIMTPYCETIQRVLKPMERFVNERDLRVKKCKGLILLEGVMCEGTTKFGRCDRSCFIFWREEWLEKVE
ncbi:MAG: hypothetical protein APF76_12195 [Desulfitibacter sp. BRH_c19]|nr:MAG: hypothetical protein APF76_12195 [Desulfitibacter sp. BRH_c19]